MLLCYLAGVCMLTLIYPYVVYPLILRLFRDQGLPESLIDHSENARVAMLFCAYNEESSLPTKINNIREIKSRLPELEVRVFADGCTDATVTILRAAEDVLELHEGDLRTGKASGMRRLVDATDADILIFTDANVIASPQSIQRLISYFRDPSIGTVAGTLNYTNPDDSTAARTGSMYWRLEETIKRLESRTGSTMGADGSLFATRRSLYPLVPPHLLDDMIASISPLFDGFRVISAPDVLAFEHATVNSGDEFRRKRRIACRAFNTHRYLRSRLKKMSYINRLKYVSHKYIRWFSAIFLLFAIVFTLAAIAELSHLSSAALTAAAGAGLVFFGRVFDVPILGSLIEVAVSIIATGIGVVESLAGRNYQTWLPARGR